MKLVLVVLAVVAAASAAINDNGRKFTHGLGGSTSRVGAMRFDGLGFWDKTTSTWTRLPAPRVAGGAINDMIGTKDGGVIVVGSFTSISSGNGGTSQTAYGFAHYHPGKGRWCGVSAANLYSRGNNDAAFPCGNTAAPATLPREPTSFPYQPKPSSFSGQNPWYPLTNWSGEKSGSGLVTGFNEMNIGAGSGMAIAQDGDNYYLFGNFNMVGDDPLLAINNDFQVCGMVQLTYGGDGAFTVAAVSGYECYTGYRAAAGTAEYKPRYCGISGTVDCSSATGTPNACNRNPHDLNVSGGAYFKNNNFILISNKEIWRWTVGSGMWTRLDEADISPSAADAGNFNGSGIDWYGTVAAKPAGFTLDDGQWASASVSADKVYVFGNADPTRAPVQNFAADQRYQHSAQIGVGGSKWTVYTQFADNARVFSLDPSPNPCPANNFNCDPQLSSSGISYGLAVAGNSAFVAFDERITERDWRVTHLAGVQYLRIGNFDGTAFGAAPGGDANVAWAAGNAPAGSNGSGATRRRYSVSSTQVDWMWSDADSRLHVHFAGAGGVMYGFMDDQNTERVRHFTKRFVGNFAMLDENNAWVQSPLGLLTGATTPTNVWQVETRVYVYNSGYTQAYNFASSSGVSLYDSNNYAWVDPFGGDRIGRYSDNRMRIAASLTGDIGSGGTVNVVHFTKNGNMVVVAGAFDFIGKTAFGSIATWDGTTVAEVVTGQGLYKRNLSGASGRPTIVNLGDQNRGSTSTGTVNTLTQDGDTLYVGGDFDTAAPGATGECLNNIASAAVGGTAWSNVGGGCDGTIRQLVVWKGRLFAGGTFTRCGLGSPGRGDMRNIAQIEIPVKTENAEPWKPLGIGLNGAVNAMTVWRVGPTGRTDLYVAGSFTSAGGIGFGGVARWNGDRWSPVTSQCLEKCDATQTVVLNTVGTDGFLRTAPRGTWHALFGTSSALYAMTTANVQGGAGANELLVFDGQRWQRATGGAPGQGTATTGSLTPFNKGIATNNSFGGVILNGATAATAATPNMALYKPNGNPNAPGNWHTFPGYTGFDGSVNVIASASLASVSAALVLLVLMAVALLM